MRSPVNRTLALAALILASGCVGAGSRAQTPPPPAANGPAADYPMVTGDPFTIGDTTYTPEDKLNYDAVGFASVGEVGGAAVSGAHKTLPLPSYVEVTSLASGRTILVRLERRGPMRNDLLIELSPGAAAQLGVAGGKAPVRVRRVNPPEPERALLRSGQQAPARMDTPKPLVDVLMRKLEKQEPLAAPKSLPNPPPPAAIEAATPESKKLPRPIPPKAVPAASVGASPPQASGTLVVQAAAFSTPERAERAAKAVGGSVKRDGRFWKLRMGPFASRAEAEAALAKARAGGYSDARIQRAD